MLNELPIFFKVIENVNKLAHNVYRMKKVMIVLAFMFLFTATLFSTKAEFIAYISSKVQFWPLAKVERLEVEFRDGFKFYVTANDPRTVGIHAIELKQIIEKAFLRNVADVVRLTHNHLIAPTMSTEDFEFMNLMRGHGFKGQFIIWCKGEFYVQ